MNKKAVALLSGGLDSTLAVCIVKEQGIEVEAVNFQTLFGCCKEDAQHVARQLGIPLTFLKVGDDYLELVRKPKYGYGRGMNPCVDCRAYMFNLAKKFMEQTGASFMVSGEVLGQRPMSQKKRDFEAIEKECGLQGLILRPLSAHCLPPTLPEKNGIVDRGRLFGIQGRTREKLLQMAAHYGIENPPSPSAGCALTSLDFGKKVKDVFTHHPDYKRWEFEILKIGRHFRLDPATKVVVARNHDQNEYLEALHPSGTTLLTCSNFGGPHALLIGEKSEDNISRAKKIMLRYAQQPMPAVCEIEAKSENYHEIWKESSQITEEELAGMRIV